MNSNVNGIKEEIIPNYDDNGNVIGYVSRKEAEKNGLLHKVVQIWILTPQGDFILQRRSKNKPNGGKWTASASGHIDAKIDNKTGEYIAESSIEAALRETEEELGIKLKPEELNLIGENYLEKREYLDTGKKIKKITDVFVVTKDINLSDINPQEGEVSHVKKCNYLIFENIVNSIKEKHSDNSFISEHFEIYETLLKVAKAKRQLWIEEHSSASR